MNNIFNQNFVKVINKETSKSKKEIIIKLNTHIDLIRSGFTYAREFS